MLYAVNPKDSIAGDICKPLINLWNAIKERPCDVKKAIAFDGKTSKRKARKRITLYVKSLIATLTMPTQMIFCFFCGRA